MLYKRLQEMIKELEDAAKQTEAQQNEEDPEDVLRQVLKMPANNNEQSLYVSDDLRTGRAMIKDENVCLHCGLCAERCPTAAWDMQKFYYSVTKAGQGV